MADGFDTEFSELYAHIVESDLPMHQKLTDAIVTLGLPAGSVVVSIGDGTGEPGVRIAKAQPDLKVFSTDASAQMTSMAAEYGAGVENVATVTVSGDDDDLASKCGVAPGSVDVSCSASRSCSCRTRRSAWRLSPPCSSRAGSFWSPFSPSLG